MKVTAESGRRDLDGIVAWLRDHSLSEFVYGIDLIDEHLVDVWSIPRSKPVVRWSSEEWEFVSIRRRMVAKYPPPRECLVP